MPDGNTASPAEQKWPLAQRLGWACLTAPRAKELLAQARATAGVRIADEHQARACFTARATAELRRS